MTNTFIRTASGKKIDYADIDVQAIDIYDIAEHLSKLPRFLGATRPFISVAQHSLHVSSLAERDGGGPIAALYGLLHDAEEAYMGDMPTPLANYLWDLTGRDIKAELSDMLTEAVYTKFKLKWPMDDVMDKRIRMCDCAALVAEGRFVKGFIPDPSWHTMDISINPMSQEQAMRSFLERYNKLTIARAKTGRAG